MQDPASRSPEQALSPDSSLVSTDAREPATHRLSVGAKLGYAAGDFGGALSYTVLSVFLLFFLVEVAGMSPGLAGLVLLSGRIFDAITDPIMGAITDRTRSRWGRRRPYLLFGAIPFGVSFAVLWMIPEASEMTMFAIACALMALHTLIFTIVAVPYGALTPEIAESYRERTSVTGYRAAFVIVASLLAFAVPPALAAGLNQGQGFAANDRYGWTVMGIALGSLMIVGWFVSFFSVKERFAHQEIGRVNLVAEYLSAFRTHGYSPLIIVFVIATTAVGIVSAILPFYFQASAGVTPETQSAMLGASFLMAAISLPAWTALSGRIGKPKALLLGLGIYAIGLLMLAVVRGGPQTMGALWGACVVTGLGLGSVLVFPGAMLPDVLEFDELETGRRREGVFYSVFTLMQKLAYALAAVIVGQSLEIVGYVRGAEVQSEGAITGLHFMLGGFTSLLLLCAAYFVRKYPITEESHRDALRELERRRGTANAVN